MKRLTFEVHDGGMFVKESDIKTYTVEDEIMYTGNAIRKLAEYEDLEARGLLKELPCRPGDYALLSNGSIVPVIYVTYTADDIEIGCQNGIHVSMSGRTAYRCSGFYRTRQEAREALERAGGMT